MFTVSICPRRSQMLRYVFVACLTLVFSGTLVAQEKETKEPTPIFDGKTLDGWHNPFEWGETKVVDGEIHLIAQKKFFLMSDKVYGDYEFEAQVRLPEGKSNSGFMARGQEEKNRVFGYQAEADPTDRKWSGGLYDEKRRGWLNPLADQPEVQDAFKKTDWNNYRIVCEGDHLQFFVNGQKTTDYRDPIDVTGMVGLQHHGEKDQLYRFRDIKIVDNGRHVWNTIFDGTSLDGWKASGDGKWELADGALRGTGSSDDKENGLLFSENTYGDFTARITFRLKEGNSGFFFRSLPSDHKSGVKGVQAELENSELMGGLYETQGRKWLARPLHYLNLFPKDRRGVVKKNREKAYKAGQWATMVVSAHGDRIVTHIGSSLACDIVDAESAKEGHFAFQLHAGHDTTLEIKKIELLEKEKNDSAEKAKEEK